MGLVNAASPEDGVVASYEYDPFGNLLSATGGADALAANPFRFSTKYFDAESGLYYYGYRYYHPQLGRWMTRDPMQEAGGVNVYAFVGNDPVNNVDPLGLESRLSQLSRQLADLEKRKDYDYSVHGKPSPVSAYLWPLILKTKAEIQTESLRQKIDSSYSVDWSWHWEFIKDLPASYWVTLTNGQQHDSLVGTLDRVTRGTPLNRDGVDAAYGHDADLEGGRAVGSVAMQVAGLVLAGHGALGMARGAAALGSAGSFLTQTTAGSYALNTASVVSAGRSLVGGIEAFVGVKLMTTNGAGSSPGTPGTSNAGGSGPAAFSKDNQAVADYLERMTGIRATPNPLEGVRGAGRQGAPMPNTE